jgi:LruC domain-containing protein
MKQSFIHRLGIAFATLSLVISCSSQQDPAAVWLLGLAGEGGTVAGGDLANVQFDLGTQVKVGTEDFLFENTKNLQVQVTVYSPFDITGTLVRVSDGQTVYFQAVVDANGNVSGEFTVNQDLNTVRIEAIYQGNTYYKEIAIQNVQVINGRIFIDMTISDYVPVVIVDTDGDGIPDSQDAYPEDPTRAAKVDLPTGAAEGGHYSVAFEDLYPAPGDMDFNDHVSHMKFSVDLNGQGRVVRIRGEAVHMAKGAGYHHTLHFGVPGAAGYNYTLTRYGYGAGNTWSGQNYVVEYEESGHRGLGESIELLPKSNTTLPASNTTSQSDNNLKIGKKAVFELILDTPLDKLPAMPFDTYIKVINTGREVHFAGLYKNADGSDRYIDSNGFPWALLVPGNFFWPYERRDMHGAYPSFRDWYSSRGVDFLDWYKTFVSDQVVEY